MLQFLNLLICTFGTFLKISWTYNEKKAKSDLLAFKWIRYLHLKPENHAETELQNVPFILILLRHSSKFSIRYFS